MTEPTAPIRKSSLPCIPPPEWEFHTWFPHPDGGGDMVPGERQRGILVRRRVSYGDWEPVRPDRWADEPPTDASSAGVVQLPPTNQDTPSRRAGLRDEIAAALEAADYRMDMRRGDLADAVLPVLYREWPWLRAEADEDEELTAEEARDLADELGTELYRAQDALAFVEECCVIADREQQPVTTADVREWLKGARCGRQLVADGRAPELPPLDQDPVARRLGLLPAPVDRSAAAVPVKQRADCTELEWAEQERARFERLYTRETVRSDLAEARADTAARDADIYQKRLERLGEAYTKQRQRAEKAEADANHNVDLVADAVQRADRAAAYRDLADQQTQLAVADDLARRRDMAAARRQLVKELRRLAAEAPATEEQQPHAPGIAVLCPACRDKGNSVCTDDETRGETDRG